jgi:uncharacterized protein (TIGR02594 family)
MTTAYDLAKAEVGTVEWAKGDNPKVVAYFKDSGNPGVMDDETAWCAAFVGAMLKRAGIKGTGKLNARSYLDWGTPVARKDAQPGDVVVFKRGNSSWQGHVAFFVKDRGALIDVLGGNQSNAVNVKGYQSAALLGIRRPPKATAKPASPAKQPRTDRQARRAAFASENRQWRCGCPSGRRAGADRREDRRNHGLGVRMGALGRIVFQLKGRRMTISEFRAWLDGFKEAVGDAPTPEQWAKVLAKLGQVQDLLPAPRQIIPNIIGPYWSPTIPQNVPSWPSVTCGQVTNMRPLDATASAAIFSDVESLYEN